MFDEQVVVGDVEAGRSARVRKDINKLVKGLSGNTFDLAEMLHETKFKNYFSEWGFESFSKFCKSLDGLKYTKSYYLVAVVSSMIAAGLSRAQYEPVGLVKLRTISRLDTTGSYKDVPMPIIIRELTLKAPQMTPEEVVFEVETILGLTLDESLVWLNIKMKKLARENCVKPALALAKKHMPESQTKDAEGNFIDPSDGAALEMICANFLADPNFNPSEPEPNTNGLTEIDDDPVEDIDSQIAALDKQIQDL